MSRYLTVERYFDATHLDKLSCSTHLHGHRFHVKVTEQAELPTNLLGHLADICDELHLHRLDEMLTGGGQTLDGLGSWILERLLINHPKITAIEVWFDPNERRGIRREIR